MNITEAFLDQTVGHLERMNAALIAPRRELLPGETREFSIKN
jgi:hypothetical protein